MKENQKATGSNLPENTVPPVDDLQALINESEQEEQPKKRKYNRTGKYAKKKTREQEQEEQTAEFLRSAMAYTLMSVTNMVSVLTGDEIWSITDQKEAQNLAMVIESYLNERFPNWLEASPEINLFMGLSSYFIPRILPKLTSPKESKPKKEKKE